MMSGKIPLLLQLALAQMSGRRRPLVPIGVQEIHSVQSLTKIRCKSSEAVANLKFSRKFGLLKMELPG